MPFVTEGGRPVGEAETLDRFEAVEADVLAAEADIADLEAEDTLRYEVFGYNAPATTTALYPRLIVGTGSDATPGITLSGVMPSPTRASRLRRIQLSCTLTPDSTTFTLQIYAYVGGTWSALSTHTATPTAAGASLIEWAEDHTIPAGGVVAIGIDPTTAPGMVNGTLVFDLV